MVVKIYVATVQGDLDFVKLEAWYLGMQDTFFHTL